MSDDNSTAFYFARLSTQMKRMPADTRNEQLRELRQHLAALALAYEENGSRPSEAAVRALEQLGDAAQIGQRLMQEWRASQSSRLSASLPALFVLGMMFISALAYWHWMHLSGIRDATPLPGLMPVVTGGFAGALFGRRGVRATVRVSGALLVVLALVCMALVVYHSRPATLAFELKEGALGTSLFVGLFACWWLPVSYFSAHGGNLLRGRWQLARLKDGC